MAEMAGKSDCRGVFRGGCTQCACDGYDGGVAGKKCDNCGHPPTKHQKLSTSGSSDSVGVPIAKFSLSGPRCSFPSCDEEAYHDLNTNTQKKLCQKHLRVMSMVQSCDLSFSDSDENECTGTAIHTAINSPQQPLESAFMKLSQSQPAFSLHNQPQTPLSTAQRADLPTSVSEFLASLALHQEGISLFLLVYILLSESAYLSWQPLQYLQTGNVSYLGVHDPDMWRKTVVSMIFVARPMPKNTRNSSFKVVRKICLHMTNQNSVANNYMIRFSSNFQLIRP